MNLSDFSGVDISKGFINTVFSSNIMLDMNTGHHFELIPDSDGIGVSVPNMGSTAIYATFNNNTDFSIILSLGSITPFVIDPHKTVFGYWNCSIWMYSINHSVEEFVNVPPPYPVFSEIFEPNVTYLDGLDWTINSITKMSSDRIFVEVVGSNGNGVGYGDIDENGDIVVDVFLASGDNTVILYENLINDLHFQDDTHSTYWVPDGKYNNIVSIHDGDVVIAVSNAWRKIDTSSYADCVFYIDTFVGGYCHRQYMMGYFGNLNSSDFNPNLYNPRINVLNSEVILLDDIKVTISYIFDSNPVGFGNSNFMHRDILERTYVLEYSHTLGRFIRGIIYGVVTTPANLSFDTYVCGNYDYQSNTPYPSLYRSSVIDVSTDAPMHALTDSTFYTNFGIETYDGSEYHYYTSFSSINGEQFNILDREFIIQFIPYNGTGSQLSRISDNVSYNSGDSSDFIRATDFPSGQPDTYSDAKLTKIKEDLYVMTYNDAYNNALFTFIFITIEENIFKYSQKYVIGDILLRGGLDNSVFEIKNSQYMVVANNHVIILK